MFYYYYDYNLVDKVEQFWQPLGMTDIRDVSWRDCCHGCFQYSTVPPERCVSWCCLVTCCPLPGWWVTPWRSYWIMTSVPCPRSSPSAMRVVSCRVFKVIICYGAMRKISLWHGLCHCMYWNYCFLDKPVLDGLLKCCYKTWKIDRINKTRPKYIKWASTYPSSFLFSFYF